MKYAVILFILLITACSLTDASEPNTCDLPPALWADESPLIITDDGVFFDTTFTLPECDPDNPPPLKYIPPIN